MSILLVYEAIDREIDIELNKGTIIRGILREIDKRENLTIETNGVRRFVSSTAINLVILPKSLLPIAKILSRQE